MDQTSEEPIEAIMHPAEININSDGVGVLKDKEKRVVTLTAKAFAEKLERLQKTRKAKLNKAGKLREDMQMLMQNKDTLKVQCVLHDLVDLCDEVKGIHGSLMGILPEDEKEKHDIWFKAKMICNDECISNVNKWLSGVEQTLPGAAHTLKVYNDDDKDDVNPEDSISNVASKHSSRKSSRSGRSSTASSTRVKAEAERAALLAQAAALQKMHALEEQEQQLKRKKEQLELETKLAASTAKLAVLQASDIQSVSKSSTNAMNSYLDKKTKTTLTKLNPMAKAYRPVNQNKQPSKDWSLPTFNPAPAAMLAREASQQCTSGWMDPNVQDVYSTTPLNASTQPLGHTLLNAQPLEERQFASICAIMEKQNEITSALVYQQRLMLLPARDIPVFDGDPLTFISFQRAFEQGVEQKVSGGDCLYYLEQFTRGQPRELVRSCQHMAPEYGYSQAKLLLQQHFGNEFKIATAYIEKVLAWPTVKAEDVNTLQNYSLFLRSCCNVMEKLKYVRELDIPTNMRAVMSKLPYKLRERWRIVAHDILEKSGQRAIFKDLVAFIEKQVQIISDPLFGDIRDVASGSSSIKASTRMKSQPLNKIRGNSFATTIVPVQSAESSRDSKGGTSPHGSLMKSTCVFCSGNHLLEKCQQFTRKKHRDRISFLKEQGLCFGCFCAGHLSRQCDKRLVCRVCGQNHPSVLHVDKRDKDRADSRFKEPVTSASHQTCGHTGAGDGRCFLSILPVQVKSAKGDRVISTYAFLDPGSTATFCSEHLMQRLNIAGRRTSFLLQTMGQERVVPAYSLSSLEVSGLENNLFYKLPEVLTQKKMPVSLDNIVKEEDLAKWPYLSEVKIPSLMANVDLLIGSNAPRMLEPWEVVNSHGEGPYAIRTALGWVINGPVHGNGSSLEVKHPSVSVNRISVSRLEQMLSEQYNHDFNERATEEKGLSREDVKFMEMAENSASLNKGHYSLRLPFKKDVVSLPNNFSVVKQRLLSLKRKFLKNEEFYEEYKTYLDGMISKGYAEQVPAQQLERASGKIWYLPHHGVYHPRKKALRVVFDCGAAFKGTSLNKQLLQGPNLTSTLLGVLIRFRQEPVAIMGDIQSMFHQVKVVEEDRDFLRFLWWPNGDLTKQVAEFRMTVHLFGAVSSPSCASFALRKTAEDNQSDFPAAVAQTVKENFYVDDCLKSMGSEEEASTMVKDLMSLCQRGGFTLTKWIGNNRTMLQTLPEEHRAKELSELNLDRDKLPVERALGLQWCVETDAFNFRMEIQQKTCTRRGMLSVSSSVYDPLGFLAPVVLPAKIMMQELCRRKVGWDETIPQDILHQWTRWMEDLDALSEFKVERCVKPKGFGHPTHAQLHHFSDASEAGYGAVTYLRIQNNRNDIHDEWPANVVETVIALDDIEVKKEAMVNVIHVEDSPGATGRLMAYFSDWMKLKVSVAWFLKLKGVLLGRQSRRRQADASNSTKSRPQSPAGQVLSAKDLWEAELAIIQYSQQQGFAEEIAALSSGGATVSRQSVIYRLDPYLDKGVLRVGGRLTRGSLPEETKHPLILPKDQQVATLIIKYIHKQLGHSGRNHTLSTMRRKYWVISANAAVRKVITECGFCRRYNGRAMEQKMADLPKERILPDHPPFTNVGVDYFGPIVVSKGRGTAKRYGVIFTCLACRAVHLEVANSLDTDACINALRRFICRRGQVTLIRSDNGTNFIGAERELREALASLNHGQIQGALRKDGVNWCFNVPAGSHHGGVWERVIRIVRRILSSVLKQQRLDDDGLQTVMCEAEAILNDRPITKLSDDPNDLEPLTPNHILLLKGKPSLPPGLFEPHDLYVKRRWRQVQYISDLFWKRWVREYLPLLQERQKWNQEKKNLKPGDIVVIMDTTAPRGSWPLGKVLESFRDKRGLVRSVRLQTKSSVIERPVTKLCLLHEVKE
ncbi:hypothetical protein N1851_023681 [Merluccius polli]|uniref:Integrase catalytic domain-containing protein n=1 Tax=Merluccius polli TaxID=89951 RepID=A0AA47MG63_MERPO|nr:hypothetical protein N1851_023681 [Merluccius polli]